MLFFGQKDMIVKPQELVVSFLVPIIITQRHRIKNNNKTSNDNDNNRNHMNHNIHHHDAAADDDAAAADDDDDEEVIPSPYGSSRGAAEYDSSEPILFVLPVK